MKLVRLLLPLLLLAGCLRAEVPALLNEIAERWTDERSRWTFTQLVKEYDGQTIAEERVERYDISRGEAKRWELVSINRRKPTPDEWEAWNKRKNRARIFAPRPL
ncbi:MAG TPA: hypothetical protein VFJ90_14145, partial [Candidatus Didemnitutus sp.]|nr:hypothetical protein [Candidatus Didemnitutus sp.]